jgi:hypothetical protein
MNPFTRTAIKSGTVGMSVPCPKRVLHAAPGLTTTLAGDFLGAKRTAAAVPAVTEVVTELELFRGG